MMNSLALAVPAPDHQLLRQVAAGDEQAFGELYDGYSLQVYNYILRLVNEPSVADEILQEVFFVAWYDAKRFREQSKVKTWLLRIAHHKAVSWLRSHHSVSSLDDLATVPNGDDRIEEQVVRAWHADQVRAALDRISPKHRAVIELVFVHDLSYTEIAEILSIPVGTVKSRMSYALKYLTGVLEEMDIGRTSG